MVSKDAARLSCIAKIIMQSILYCSNNIWKQQCNLFVKIMFWNTQAIDLPFINSEVDLVIIWLCRCTCSVHYAVKDETWCSVNAHIVLSGHWFQNAFYVIFTWSTVNCGKQIANWILKDITLLLLLLAPTCVFARCPWQSVGWLNLFKDEPVFGSFI